MKRVFAGWMSFCCGLGMGLGQAGTVPGPVGNVAASLANASLTEARGLAAKGKLDAALAELEVLAGQTPEEAGVERLRGVILYQKEKFQEAGIGFARAVQQDPEDRESRTMLGITLYRLGRPGDAIPLLEGVAASARDAGHPESPGAETDLTPSPQERATEVEHSRPDSPGSEESPVEGLSSSLESRYVLGLCYTDVKRYDDARRAFAAEFGFGEDSAEGYLVAARLFLRREFADQAGLFARKALEIEPGLPLAHQLLGEVALAKADLPEAVKELEAERKVNPLNGDLYDRLGDAYLRNGQFAEAREALDRAVLLEPNATGPYILLGETLVKLGEPIEALHYLKHAEEMDASNGVVHHALGDAYRAMGQMEEANREFKLAVSLQRKS